MEGAPRHPKVEEEAAQGKGVLPIAHQQLSEAKRVKKTVKAREKDAKSVSPRQRPTI